MYEKNWLRILLWEICRPMTNPVVMKLSLAIPLLLMATLQVNASAFGQEVSLQRKNVKLDYVLRELQKQSGYNILFDQRIIPASVRVNVNYKDAELNQVLVELLAPYGIHFRQPGKNIVLNRKSTSNAVPPLRTQQQKTIGGTVRDIDGTPMSGVTIRVNDNVSDGAMTDENGEFSILASPQDRLTFSFVGKEAVSVTVGDRQELNIVLRDQSVVMDDLVVVAYGTQKKTNLTGSVVSVGSEEIEKTTLQDPISILQGRAPGVQITSNSGAPGAEMTIRVRGNSSLNA